MYYTILYVYSKGGIVLTNIADLEKMLCVRNELYPYRFSLEERQRLSRVRGERYGRRNEGFASHAEGLRAQFIREIRQRLIAEEHASYTGAHPIINEVEAYIRGGYAYESGSVEAGDLIGHARATCEQVKQKMISDPDALVLLTQKRQWKIKNLRREFSFRDYNVTVEYSSKYNRSKERLLVEMKKKPDTKSNNRDFEMFVLKMAPNKNVIITTYTRQNNCSYRTAAEISSQDTSLSESSTDSLAVLDEALTYYLGLGSGFK